ncbi:hypothetical protein EMIT0215P_210018 [Pseudomonas serboccidentalis]
MGDVAHEPVFLSVWFCLPWPGPDRFLDQHPRLKAKDRSLRQLLQGIHVGAAAGCDLLILLLLYNGSPALTRY